MSETRPIFISYRRSDEPFAATLLYDKLAEAFGSDRIFKDVDSFQPGDDFPVKLAQFVEESDIVLAVIGPNWLTAEDALGRRIENPLDWVRIEIVSALEKEKRVVPVLVNGAEMPATDDLPESLQPLAHKHAFRVSAERAAPETQGLIKSLTRMLDQVAQERADAALKAEAEAERRAEERAAREREEALKAEQAARAAQAAAPLSSAQVDAMRAIQNWDHIRPRRDLDEHRDHIARFPEDDTTRFARVALDALVWDATDPASRESLDAYLAEFPEGAHAAAAQAARADLQKAEMTEAEAPDRRRAEDAAWAEAKDGDGDALSAFLGRFPEGAHAAEARQRFHAAMAGSGPAAPEATASSARQVSRRGLLLGGALAAAGAAGLVAWNQRPGGADRALLVFDGHSASVNSVSFAPDGAQVVSGSSDGTLRVWGVETAMTRRVITGHNGPILTVSFSPDGVTALSGGVDNALRQWALNTGTSLKVLTGHSDRVTSVSYSPDGVLAMSGSADGTVRSWDLRTGTGYGMAGHGDTVTSVAWAPRGLTGLSGSADSSIRIWDLAAGRMMGLLEAEAFAVRSVAFLPNGVQALSGHGDGTLRLWDLAEGETRRVLKWHPIGLFDLAVSPDGKTALSCGRDQTLHFWDLETGEKRAVLTGHKDTVNSVAFAPDGESAISGSSDHTLRLWDLRGL